MKQSGYISDIWTSKEDREYCLNCIYSPARRMTIKHLCDYYSKTGVRRGCHAGVGCTKRELRGDTNANKSTV